MSKANQMLMDRLRFLKAYYDIPIEDSDSPALPSMKFSVIGEQLQFDETRTRKLAHQLARDGLLKAVGIGGLYAITSKGVEAVESEFSQAREPSL